jgi:ABC-type antimicrobial peptide transport system ATPase subunit
MFVDSYSVDWGSIGTIGSVGAGGTAVARGASMIDCQRLPTLGTFRWRKAALHYAHSRWKSKCLRRRLILYASTRNPRSNNLAGKLKTKKLRRKNECDGGIRNRLYECFERMKSWSVNLPLPMLSSSL